MENTLLKKLISAYQASPSIFHATKFWASKQDLIVKEIERVPLANVRTGKSWIFSTFGFGEDVFKRIRKPFLKVKIIASVFKKVVFEGRVIMPYSIDLRDIREMAYHHCELFSELTKAIPVSKIQSEKFGKPEDLFEMKGNTYSMQFLSYYIRYCFAQKHVRFKGDETIVELGSGSGQQVEILKKLYPNLTILCFDLPPQLYLCEKYISKVFGAGEIVSAEETLDWTNLSDVKPGKIHFLGNWKSPLLKNWKFDLFWNAASFGEMEPEVVKNYLSYVKDNCSWIYLMQIRAGNYFGSVIDPITFYDYNRWLNNFLLTEEHDAYFAFKRITESEGYFEAVWKTKGS